MSSIIVAVIINLITLGIIVGGVFTGRRDGVRVTAIKAIITLGGGVGMYFLSPVIIDGLNTIYGFAELTTHSFGYNTLYALLLTIGTLIIFGLSCIIGAIVKHCIIKGKRKEITQNKAKVRLARSINAKGTKENRKKSWRILKSEFKKGRTRGSKALSEMIAFVLFTVIAFVFIFPYAFIAKVLVNNDAEKQYLLDGYEYTLNGVVDSEFPEITDFLSHTEAVEVADVEEDADSAVVDEETVESTETEEVESEVGTEETNNTESEIEG